MSEAYDNPRFRITASSGRPTALAAVPRPFPDPFRRMPHGYELTPAGGIVSTDVQVKPTWASAGESYLALQKVDLEDPDAILSFVNEYGILGARWMRPPPPLQEIITAHTHGGAASGWKRILNLAMVPHSDIFSEIEEAVRRTEHESSPEEFVTETVTEFRLAAQLVRDLTAAWRLTSTGAEPSDWESPITRDAFTWDTTQEVLSEPSPADAAAIMLERYLSAMLTPFHPRIRRAEAHDDHDAEPWQDSPSLFWFCGLELYRHVAEQALYRVCENDRCRQLFVRQEGRALHAQHRTKGIKYCSPQCSRAVAQRRYRERQKTRDR